MTAKRREAPAETQGELEMMVGDPAPGVPPPSADEAGDEAAPEAEDPVEATDGPMEEIAAADEDGAGPEESSAGPEGALEPPATPGVNGDSRLHTALEGLDERVTFMIERFDDLRRRHAQAVEAGQRAEAALARRGKPGTDPAELDARIRELEAENERLARHAGFLEERIQSLLSRVRYVIEA